MAAAQQTVTYPIASGKLLGGCGLSFLAALLILIAFASPYWLESYAETFQPFIRMGLWEFCFKDFRYPGYQYDQKFDGCHYIFSEHYLVIRQWLQPGWLMFVEAMMCMALMFSLLSLVLLAIVLMRYWFKYEFYMIGVAFLLQITTAFPTFLAVAVFGARCQERSWLMYPLFNHPSWAYGFAVVAFFINIVAAVLLFMESKESHERKRRTSRLVSDTTPYRY